MLAELVPKQFGNPSAWLAQADGSPLWLRAQGLCTELTPTPDGTWGGEIRICERTDARGVTTCGRDLTLEDEMLRAKSVSCHTKHPGGMSGSGGGSINDHATFSILAAPGDPHAEVGHFFAVSARPRKHLLVHTPCEPGSVARAFREAEDADPTGSVGDRSEALRRSHGIAMGATGRTCPDMTGLYLFSESMEEGSGGFGIGITPVYEDVPVDCSQPCPQSPIRAKLVAINERLGQWRFAKREADQALLFTSIERCEANLNEPELSFGASERCEG